MPRFEEILESIETPVGLVTSSPKRWIDIVFERFDRHDVFDVIASAEDVGHGKPAPDVYLRAASALGVDPTDCLAIEDSTNGITAASRADMSAIAYGDPSEKAVSIADTVAQTSAELLTTLRE